MKKYIAELFATFVLTLVVLLSLSGDFPVATPVLAGLTVLIFVYTIGGISGAMLNPAVTIGLWSIKKVNARDAIYFIVAQFMGAVLAMLLVANTLGGSPALVTDQNLLKTLAEALGAMILTFGIASVVFGKTLQEASGATVGLSLLIGIAMAVLLTSNGVLNPAVALALGTFNLTYLLGPIVGAIAGFNLYKYLVE